MQPSKGLYNQVVKIVVPYSTPPILLIYHGPGSSLPFLSLTLSSPCVACRASLSQLTERGTKEPKRRQKNNRGPFLYIAIAGETYIVISGQSLRTGSPRAVHIQRSIQLYHKDLALLSVNARTQYVAAKKSILVGIICGPERTSPHV
jgi:hypothetical protein